MKKILLYLFFLFSITSTFSTSFSEVINNIIIQGNKKILPETILEYGQIKKNQNYTSDDLNNIQKKIFSTGFFEKIELSLIEGNLNISVIENPLINFFSIEGDISTDDKNKLFDLIKLGPNKIYSEYILKNDLDYIKNYFTMSGYSEVEVYPRISKLENDNINVLINIKKNKEEKVNRIFFIGDKKFNNSDLYDVITTSEYSWWKFLSSTNIVNQDRVLYDKELLKKYYLNNGYFDVQITSVDINQLPNKMSDITFSISSGDLYNFGTFKISEGENLLTQKVLSYVDFLKNKYFNKIYSQENIKKFLDDLNNFIAQSKIEFVDTSASQLKNNNKIDIVLNIKQSKKKYVEKINVIGNSITEEKVIRRNLTFSEGDSYLEFKKKKSLDNLKSLNIFKDVKIDTKDSSSENTTVDISVTEQPTGSLSAGAGYGADGGLISFGLNEKNFLGEGVILDSNVTVGTQKIIASISSTVPDFKYTGNTLYTSLFSTKTNLINTLYESRKTGLDFATRYEIKDNLFLKPGLGIDYENINILPGASAYFQSQKGSFISQRINYNLELDKRDNKFKTRNGSLIGFTQEVSSFASDLPYLKNYVYGSTYFPLSQKQTLNLKYGYSNISSLNNDSVKLSDRQFIPYQFTKGFEPRGFGPKDTASGDFIGGNNSVYTNISATLPNPVQDNWNINTVFFINAFNVWGTDNSSAFSSNNSIRTSTGVGLDWRSPIGPVNISISKPISKESTDKTKIFSFEIGTIF